jgi:phospho-N-acetylmuramoyl-pentapeptide-transferase
MFYNLLYPLVDHLSALNVLRYITVRSAYAAVTALLIAFLAGPWLIRKLRELKAGQSVRQDGPQSHLVKTGTPTMGGLLMILGIAVSMLLWMDLTHPVTWILFVALIGFGGVGFADDLLKILARNSKGIPSWAKVAGQFAVATVCMLWLSFLPGYDSYLYVPFLKAPVLNLGLLMIPFGMFLMIGWSNAVNVTDGLDGLATGLVILVGLALAALAYLSDGLRRLPTDSLQPLGR